VVFNLADFCNSPNCQNKFYTKFSSYTVSIYITAMFAWTSNSNLLNGTSIASDGYVHETN